MFFFVIVLRERGPAAVGFELPSCSLGPLFLSPVVFLAFPFRPDLDDSWQMTNIFELPCNPTAGQPGNCNPQQMQLVANYRADTLAALQPVLASPIHGGFFTDCIQHCHTNIQFCFSSALVQNQTEQDTFWAWYEKTVFGVAPPPGVLTRVIDGAYGTNPTCTTSCSPY
jgi:hypothetical protein